MPLIQAIYSSAVDPGVSGTLAVPMSGAGGSRRSSRPRKETRHSDSDIDDKDFLDDKGDGGARSSTVLQEGERLAKIQEKNRKGQQKCAPTARLVLT